MGVATKRILSQNPTTCVKLGTRSELTHTWKLRKTNSGESKQNVFDLMEDVDAFTIKKHLIHDRQSRCETSYTCVLYVFIHLCAIGTLNKQKQTENAHFKPEYVEDSNNSRQTSHKTDSPRAKTHDTKLIRLVPKLTNGLETNKISKRLRLTDGNTIISPKRMPNCLAWNNQNENTTRRHLNHELLKSQQNLQTLYKSNLHEKTTL